MATISTVPVSHASSRARVWLKRLIIVVLATFIIGYLTISTVAANILTIPVRKQVTLVNGEYHYTTSPKAVDLNYQDVKFESRVDHVPLKGWFIPASDSPRAIIVVHGKDSCRPCEFKNHMLDFTRSIHERGFNVLMIDLRGHGESGTGHFTFGAMERRDIEGAADWLKAQGFTPHHIGLMGVSMGAASSIDATADDPDIAALVADCSYAEIYPVLQAEFPKASHLPSFFLPSTVLMARFSVGVDINNPRPVNEIRKAANRPLLIIHGTDDQLIPVSHAKRLADAAPGAQLWLVEGAGHAASYAKQPVAYVDRVASFFNSSLR